MRKFVISSILIISSFFLGCKSKDFEQNDIVGTWVSSDGATIELNKDSSFVGKSLPAEYFTFFISKNDIKGKRVSGSGRWKIENGQQYKEVKLSFSKMENKDINGFYSVIIAGENGTLDNKPPWYLFVWKEEEGGDQYKFKKQKM